MPDQLMSPNDAGPTTIRCTCTAGRARGSRGREAAVTRLGTTPIAGPPVTRGDRTSPPVAPPRAPPPRPAS
jgi:hypothetical protein